MSQRSVRSNAGRWLVQPSTPRVPAWLVDRGQRHLVQADDAAGPTLCLLLHVAMPLQHTQALHVVCKVRQKCQVEVRLTEHLEIVQREEPGLARPSKRRQQPRELCDRIPASPCCKCVATTLDFARCEREVEACVQAPRRYHHAAAPAASQHARHRPLALCIELIAKHGCDTKSKWQAVTTRWPVHAVRQRRPSRRDRRWRLLRVSIVVLHELRHIGLGVGVGRARAGGRHVIGTECCRYRFCKKRTARARTE